MTKQNKAQIIIITLWIMIILSLLAVSVANRVSLGLRLSRYARDGIKAEALSMAGINRAVIEIMNDTNGYDALSEPWANDETKFKEIKLDDNNEGEVFSVAYEKPDPAGKPVTVYGVSDEDSKININVADQALLQILLQEFNISEAQKLAKNILTWRGETNIPLDDDSRVYTGKGYPCKKQPFANIQELLLVKDMDIDTYNTIKDFITTDTGSTQIKININTASPEIIDVLIKYEINSRGLPDSGAGARLLDAIITRRDQSAFISISDIVNRLNLPNESEENNIFNGLQSVIDVQSQYFRIISIGIIKKPLLIRRIECVYDKPADKIRFWHQN